jgi:hypothetical protein
MLMPGIGEGQHEPADISLFEERQYLGERDVAIVRPLVISPADVEPDPVARHIDDCLVDCCDDKAIAGAQAPFVSRGDKSGTDALETSRLPISGADPARRFLWSHDFEELVQEPGGRLRLGPCAKSYRDAHGNSPSIRRFWWAGRRHLIPNAPKPVAPYSHVVEVDGWLFVTGQLATDPDDDSLPLPEGIEAQTRKVMDNLKRALAGAGAGFEHVVCVRQGAMPRPFGP